jgi:hypothetical protein
MKELYHNGMHIETPSGQQTVYVIVNAMTMDLNARACVFNMMQHNGLCACLYCEEPGIVKSGKGHTRCFPFRETKPQLRTTLSIEANVNEAVKSKKAAFGFYGTSIIKHLPWMEFHENRTIDYMHGFLLGIMKKLLDMWIDGANYQQPYFIGHKL